MPDDDTLSSALEEIRARAAWKDDPVRTAAAARDSAEDVPRLLAAIQDGALKLADDWEQEARRLHAIAAGETGPQSRIAVSLRAQAFEDCARALREAITREIGKEPDRGRTRLHPQRRGDDPGDPAADPQRRPDRHLPPAA